MDELMQFNSYIVKYINDALHKIPLCPLQLIDLEVANFEYIIFVVVSACRQWKKSYQVFQIPNSTCPNQ